MSPSWHEDGGDYRKNLVRKGCGQMMNNHQISIHDNSGFLLFPALQEQMEKLTERIQLTAPVPGRLVYIAARLLPFQLYGLPPILLSSLDGCTHLQLARVYFTQTAASAIDFLEFIRNEYPFSIREVRTYAHQLFCASGQQHVSRFTSYAQQLGIGHSVFQDKQDDILFLYLSTMFFEPDDQFVEPVGEQDLIQRLSSFLFLHNNQRSFSTLNGRTPVQRLQMFHGYEHIEVFDPFAVLKVSR
jgi:hypothetical protein